LGCRAQLELPTGLHPYPPTGREKAVDGSQHLGSGNRPYRVGPVDDDPLHFESDRPPSPSCRPQGAFDHGSGLAGRHGAGAGRHWSVASVSAVSYS